MTRLQKYAAALYQEMLAVGINTAGLTHAGSVVAAQALLQLNEALMIDILTAGGDPDLAVARAPLYLGQALIGGTFFSSSAPPSSHTLLRLFPGTHCALVGLPGNHSRMARKFERLNREFCAMYQQQENLVVLLEDVSRTLRRLDSEACDERSASLITAVGRGTSAAMVTRGTEGAAVVTAVVVVSVACIINT